MVAPSMKFTPCSDVVHTKIKNGGAVLLHLGTNQYFTLNETGACIWELIAEGLTVEEISRKLEAIYDITLDNAQHSVVALIDGLIDEGLVTVDSQVPTFYAVKA